MSQLKPIKDHQNLVKDTTNGGVINDDVRSFEAYKIEKAAKQRELAERKAVKDQMNQVNNDINTIRNELHELKDLLVQLVKKD